ncbi:MAG: hypothetical protein WCJ49_02750, partial [Deltaproteobacteria bacterium]
MKNLINKVLERANDILVAIFFAFLSTGAINFYSMFSRNNEIFNAGISNTFMIISSATAFCLGAVIARFFTRQRQTIDIATIGCILVGVGFFVSSFSTSPLYYFGGFGILSSLGFGIVFVVSLSFCVGWFPHFFGLATGFMLALFFVGGSFFDFLSYYLLVSLGNSAGMFFAGMIYSFFIFLSLQFIRRAPSDNIEFALQYGSNELLSV